MTAIAPHITAFLRERLPRQRGASEHTCQSYAYAFQLLFRYASERFNVNPSALEFEQLDAPLIMDFLEQLEAKRGNTASTRNARLAAIKSFMRFCEYREPAILEQSRRILAIPFKRTDIALIDHLSTAEMEAILNAPDLSVRAGIRDRAMLHLCFSAGLRVSELVGLPLAAVDLQSPSILVQGKGRRARCLPLWKQTTTDLRAWLAVRGEALVPELFLSARGQPMTRSGFEYVLRKHVRTASEHCPSLKGKRVSPHVLRHSCAMMILQATGDLRKVSLWLGHADMQTTEVYLRADPTDKLEAIEAIIPPALKRGRFTIPDKLIEALQRS
ncbi:MAG: tyrosine-type recombinase/integrase [Chromatiaceae bacterium]